GPQDNSSLLEKKAQPFVSEKMAHGSLPSSCRGKLTPSPGILSLCGKEYLRSTIAGCCPPSDRPVPQNIKNMPKNNKLDISVKQKCLPPLIAWRFSQYHPVFF
ncbi:MAG: hypothetical protein KJ717_12885, partial [Proteobacteria bacterium]|nr:hypothetical protein [Pseudomonadota bacterium]